jgi:hypothetical protein
VDLRPPLIHTDDELGVMEKIDHGMEGVSGAV